ncbi:MAG: hypothetical protein EOO89_28860, partial [Pedobacter sp.]
MALKNKKIVLKKITLQPGAVSTLPLNNSLLLSRNKLMLANPAAKLIKKQFSDELEGFETNNTLYRLTARLKKGISTSENIDVSVLEGFEFQEQHKLPDILPELWKVNATKESITLILPGKLFPLSPPFSHVETFKITAIAIFPDFLSSKCNKVSLTSGHLPTDSSPKDLKFEFPVPEDARHYILALKVGFYS